MQEIKKTYQMPIMMTENLTWYYLKNKLVVRFAKELPRLLHKISSISMSQVNLHDVCFEIFHGY